MRIARVSIALGIMIGVLIGTACDSKEEFSVDDLPQSSGNEPLTPEASRHAITAEDSAVKMTREVFGKLPDGKDVEVFTLDNGKMKIKLMTYGATLISVEAPDRNGNLAEVTLGFDKLDGYLKRHPYFGSTVGRYANRIARGKFKLRDKEYQLTINNPPNHLHGGEKGFDQRLWTVESIRYAADACTVALAYESADGEEGYPGNLRAVVAFTLNTNNEISMEFNASADRPTVVNLTNHAYWNLSGKKDSTILDHQLTISAERYLPVDKTLIPTGELAPVKGTVFDFNSPHLVGERIGELKGEPGGYDHCYVLAVQDGAPAVRPAARLVDPSSGRMLEVLTTQPGLQFYSGNFLDGEAINGGYPKHGGLCLEAQHFPDSPNHPEFPPTLLAPQRGAAPPRPENAYRHIIVYRLGVVDPSSDAASKE